MADKDPFVKLLREGEAYEAGTPMFWEAQTLPYQLVVELRRRSNQNNIGLFNTQDICTNFTPENYKAYKGPMVPWIRCFSFGKGRRNNTTVPLSQYLSRNPKSPNEYKGFLLQAGDGFYRGYGVAYENKSLNKTDQILGYQSDGTPHKLHLLSSKVSNFYNISDDKYTPGMLPPPGITNVDIQTIKETFLSYVSITWKCYGLAQLEYMMPFFLTPGINLFLEFGWNLFNIKSLINYNNIDECLEIKKHPDIVVQRYFDSMCNYGCFSGIIWKYDINQKDGVQFECKTEIISAQAMYAGFRTEKNNSKNNSFGIWIKENLKKIKDVVQNTINLRTQQNNYNNNKNKTELVQTGFSSVGGAIYTKQSDLVQEPSTANDYRNNCKIIRNSINTTEKEIQKDKESLKVKQEEYNKIQREIIIENNQYLSQRSNVRTGGGNIYEAVYRQGYNEDVKKLFEKKYPELYSSLTNEIETLKTRIDRNNEALKILNKQFEENYEGLKSTVGNFVQYIKAYLNKDFSDAPDFYDGKDEDRFFLTPEFGLYHDNNNPYIYKSNNKEFVYSKEENTFKSSENYALHGWVQLDFIIELLNYIIKHQPENHTPYEIDISETIVTAHPNLISCDPNVIIPNRIAPKLNVPTPLITNTSGNIVDNGNRIYIGKKGDDEGNAKLLEQLDKNSDMNDSSNVLNSKYNNIDVVVHKDTYLKYQDETVYNFINQTSTNFIDDNEKESRQELIYRSLRKCKKLFLIKDSSMRDNIDVIVNRLYYEIGNNDSTYSCIPFLTDYKTKRYEIDKYDENGNKILLKDSTGKDVDGETYTKYNYGFLKYVYISVNKLIDLYDSMNENGTIEDYVRLILKTINSSVCDYWNLDVVVSGDGKLKIVDRGIGYNRENIYTFEVGTTNSAIKSFSFNINLTKEQTTQVLFSSGNNKESDDLNTDDATCQDIKEKNLPAFAYKDILNDILREEELSKNNNKTNKEIELKRQNDAIQVLQTSAVSDPNTNIVRLKFNNDGKESTVIGDKYSYVCLNLPPNLSTYLKDLLYTPLLQSEEKPVKEDNGYTGPADNFILNLTFDGIMGFKIMQHIAIDNLPAPFNKENVFFVVNEVRHQINNSKWETVVTCMLKSCHNQKFNYILI